MRYSQIYMFLLFILFVDISCVVHASEWDGIDGALRSAAYDGDLQRTTAALDEGADINSQTRPDKPTALMYAATNGHVSVVRLLLMRGADPNILTSNGDSAIAFAMQNKHPEAAVMLLEHGADPNTRCPFSWQTLMQCAAAHGNAELVSKLFDKEVDVDMGDPTPLELASSLGNVQIVEILLQRGADVNLNPDGKLSALDGAKSGGHTQIVKMLEAAGAVDTRAEIDESPAGNFKRILVKHLSDPELKGQMKYTDSEGVYEFGLGICDALRNGLSQTQILDDNYYHFWGVEVSDAMWESALEVICPQLAP